MSNNLVPDPSGLLGKPIAVPPLMPRTKRFGFLLICFHNICRNDGDATLNIRVLVADGLHGQQSFDFVRATNLARPLYASPVWCGFNNSGEGDRFNCIHRN